MKKLTVLLSMLVISAIMFAQMETNYPEGLKVGDEAPDFNIADQNGKNINLKTVLKTGEVALIFYRGQWCPYCNKQLSNLNDSLSFIAAKGATVIAVTPETSENIKKTITKTKTSYSILEDKNMAIMKAFKVNFAVDKNTIKEYKNYGIDFDKANGSNGANLPVPATYIIGMNGKIKYAFFNIDYSKRASVKDMLDNL